MNETLQTFLKNGLKHYWEASSTLRLFEGEMKGLMEKSLKERKDWHPLKSHKLAVSRPGGGPDGRWIPCMIDGVDRLSRKVRIDCGLWWNARKCDLDSIVYCSFWDEPKAVLGFAHENTKAISSFKYHSRTILYSAIPVDLKIGAVLNGQMDCLLRKLK